MITFDKPNCQFIISVTGDLDDYLATMRAIIRLIQHQDQNMINVEDNYSALQLLEDMLPSEEQMHALADK